MTGPDELDEGLAADLRELAEGLRRRRELLRDDALHAAADNDLAQAVKLLERAADTLLSTE